MTRLMLPLMLMFAVPAFALAPEDEDSDGDFGDLDEDETDEEKKAREEAEKARLEGADQLDLIDDEDELDKIQVGGDDEEGEEPGDLLGDGVDKDVIEQEGQDTSEIYRKASEDFGDLAPDEEMLAWDRYLRQYPKSVYKDRIERRLDDLEAQLYQERRSSGDDERLDADKREVPISQGLLIENINPRTRVQTGFEWGLPNYINLMADYEHGLTRELSVHAGLRNRFQTWNFEFGGRYAIIKSSRTKTLLTGIMDFRMALSPAYLAVRPQLAFGKMIGIVDVQVQAGVDYELRKYSSLRLIGGANVTLRADENVGVFVETNINTKGLTWADGGDFRFPVGSFGLKLYPDIPNQDKGFMEVNIGASIPYATRYYRWHDGSIMGQVNFYL